MPNPNNCVRCGDSFESGDGPCDSHRARQDCVHLAVDGGVSRCMDARTDEDLTRTTAKVTCKTCVMLIEYDRDYKMEQKMAELSTKRQFDWSALFCAIAQECSKRRDNAGHDGRWDDGGASDLEKQVKFFKMGMNGQMPTEWEPFITSLDPEYNEYQRLKQKFKGR